MFLNREIDFFSVQCNKLLHIAFLMTCKGRFGDALERQIRLVEILAPVDIPHLSVMRYRVMG